MSDVTININGGNNQILPNAMHAEQHFHYHNDSTACPAAIDESNDENRQRLALYIDKEENLNRYIAQLHTCKTASDVGCVVATMWENEPKLDAERIVKKNFIELLLPYLTQVSNGRGIDNLRIQISKACELRKKELEKAR